MKITEVLELLELKDIPIRVNTREPEQERERVEPKGKSYIRDVEKYNKHVAKSMAKVNKPVDSGIPYKELKPAIVGMIKDTIKNKDIATLNKILNVMISKFKEDQQEEIYLEIVKLKGWDKNE